MIRDVPACSRSLRQQVAPLISFHSFKMGGGGKVPYPKEVWSPAGGWYAQPANWKANTAIMAATIVGIVAATWTLSAEREHRDRMPQPGRFFPSRYWSKQILEHERQKSGNNES